MKKIYQILRLLLFLAGVAGFACPVFSQASQESAELRLNEQQRQDDDKDSRDLKATEKVEKTEDSFQYAYGAWLFFDYRNYKDIDNDTDREEWVKNLYLMDSRIWGKVLFHNTVMGYARIKNLYLWRPDVSSDYTGIGDDYEGPSIDSLYAAFYLRDKFKIPLSVKVGRHYMSLGRGIAYSDIHDGVSFDYQPLRYVLLKGFVSKTKRFDNNLDYSVPGYKDENERYFLGVEAAFIAAQDVLYFYSLVQRDRSQEFPEDVTQDYSMDTEHLGVGVSGKRRNMTYWGELIKGFGKSHTYGADSPDGRFAIKDIDSWAANVGAKYKIDRYSHPVIEAEMGYGSGDKERASVTNTIGGNISGKDHNFHYFGVFNGGYALYPRLSNIYIYKIGVSCKPFEFLPHVGDDIAVGVRYYLYRKDRKDGGIYDVDATVDDLDIGQEMDLFLHWRVYVNFYITARYGLFFPGEAYPSTARDASQYVLLRARMIF